MAKKAKAADVKIRKKKWIQIISTFFGDRVIGDTAVFESKEAIGRTVKINLMNLAGDPRKQNIDILFQVEDLRGETAVTAKVKGYFVQEPSLRKMVRRGKTKVQDSYKCMTQDNIPVEIKEFILTRTLVNNSIATRIRKTARRILVEKVSKMSFDAFIGEVIQNKVQRELKAVVDKIYPTKLVEFNKVHVVKATVGKFLKPGEEDMDSRQSNKEEATEETSESQADEGTTQADEIVSQADEVSEESSAEETEETTQ